MRGFPSICACSRSHSRRGSPTCPRRSSLISPGSTPPRSARISATSGTYGVRGVGYDVEYLIYQFRRELGLDHDWPVVIVGAGNLGQALAGYGGFRERGYPVAGIVDIDPAKVGLKIGDVEVRPISELNAIVRRDHVSIGVIATPAAAAQVAADRLVAAGLSSILNFAAVLLTLPPTVSVRKVDLAVELQILSYYGQRRVTAAAVTPRGQLAHGG